MLDNQNTIGLHDFSSIALLVASPEKIADWSHGEIFKPETINYRTQKPEREGLFCEKIFGPTKNWECYCGKYKKIKYKGIVCEKCGVEVTRSVVRRERMGHIKLAVPVAHIWFLRSTPSRIGLLLDLPIKALERVVGFSAYIVKSIDEDGRTNAIKELEQEFSEVESSMQEEARAEMQALEAAVAAKEAKKGEIKKLQNKHLKEMDAFIEEYEAIKLSLESLEVNGIVSEMDYVRLRMRFGHLFDAGIGAEALYEIIKDIDLEVLNGQLQDQLKHETGIKQKKTYKRIKFIQGLIKSNIRPEWMILTILPVIPPDLRPMVALDGGRFAASDLNDLYRRVINRNNRLRRLLELGAPEVICRNEKRILQEAVDALLNNSARAGKAVFIAGDRRKYKSLSDILKGKQGRFRQNLLGKRVDYSGRSVIVVNPTMKMHQCGLPKKMALELFKPFVLGKLVQDGIAHNVKYAERMIEWGRSEVWDALEEVITDHYVLLNRAPTLHRLGIQAFQPQLIEGKAIQIHPLVCAAFNADFDGDQMAVHLPLSAEAQEEAKTLMVSSRNLLKPSDGEPIINPSQDMILGCYFVTQEIDGAKGEGSIFGSFEEAKYAFDTKNIEFQSKIKIRIDGKILETTYGRVLFNRILPETMEFKNYTFGKSQLKNLMAEVFEVSDMETTAQVADAIKDFGFEYASVSGITMSIYDFHLPGKKSEFIDAGTDLTEKINTFFRYGLLTEEERYLHTLKIWNRVKKDIEGEVKVSYAKENPVFTMVDSGARANWGNITQVAGMKGLVANPSGKAIEVPIKSSLKEGFSILEYFIGTHGGRKGKADTALKTASAGYLTRRLVDSVQDVIIREDDCGTDNGYIVDANLEDAISEPFNERIFGRTLVKPACHPETGEVIADAGVFIDKELSETIANSGVEQVELRSVMTCRTVYGICKKCYGADLANRSEIEIGSPAGIIAAQSIGEPGTQLTMRTFHMGGVASEEKDMTAGLERVEELFECRAPKTQAEMSPIDGKVTLSIEGDRRAIIVTAHDLHDIDHQLYGHYDTAVKEGDQVREKQIIARLKKGEGKGVLRAKTTGVVQSVSDESIVVKQSEKDVCKYLVPIRETLKVQDGDSVVAGQAMTLGHLNLRDLMAATDTYTVQKYIIDEVQSIYASQGQSVARKHIEVITRQMLSKVSILDPGETNFLSGETTSLLSALEANKEADTDKKRPCVYERLLLGLTKVAIHTDSWLAAASFQETIRVLIEAAVTHKVDKLRGLKENVIMGRHIPAGRHYKALYEAKSVEDTEIHDENY
ncbi:MAG: DNA-directed RNA polymerase subunit beta' [Patescibacteria group bacterium]|nr:DNA-directed RNA polymerase subunit beta' [Patescibacteria group bacterium]